MHSQSSVFSSSFVWVWEMDHKEGWELKNWCFWTVCVSRSVVSDSLQHQGLYLSRLLFPWDFPGKNAGVGCHYLLQGIFLIQGLNQGLLHCRQIFTIWATREALELWWWRKLLRVLWTPKRSNQSIQRKPTLNIHWKHWCCSWSSNTLATWWEEPIHW